MYSNLKTYLILFGGVFALSTSAIFVKIADAPSSVTAFYRAAPRRSGSDAGLSPERAKPGRNQSDP